MNRFIAYFDYLGFKEFIEKNDLDFQKEVIGNNFRDMESALGQGKLKDAPYGVIADISKSQINCINFSDTVVFFTNDTNISSLLEIIEVAYNFNIRAIDDCFPVRGALVFGEMIYIDYKQTNSCGGTYNINSVFGKGLVRTHLRADNQHWAGTVLDESLISEIVKFGYNIEEFLLPFAKKHKVPYKNGDEREEEFVLNIIKGTLNNESLENFCKRIRDNFAQYNKAVDDPRVQEKISNTLHFLESYLVKEEKTI